MNILYITQYYPPEIGATQTRAVEMAKNLVQRGHAVTVLTEFPNHPTGVIPEKYRFKLFQRETDSGIDVLRMWVYARPKKNFATRMLFYLSFMVTAIIGGLALRKKFDVVFATSPPLFVGAAGAVICFFRRAKLVLEVRDLWPETAVILGELSNKYFINLSEKLELFLYNTSERIVTVTSGFKNRIIERAKVPPEKIIVIPNGANTELYRPGEKDTTVLQNLDIDAATFIIGYTGLHGLMHGLDFVVEVANQLREEKDIFFLFIGEGVRKAHLIETARKYGLGNMMFLEAQAEEQLPRYIQTCDLGLTTIKKTIVSDRVIPVKVFTYMACAKPVLLCVDGETREIVEQAGAGLFAEPENVDQLKDAILKLKNDPARCRTMGQNGRRLVEQHYSRAALAQKLEQCLLEASAGR
ncbi:MAG: glycosyltransferase family 4 protein [Candidatus Zhuqueibacterota bacterium]